MDRLRHAILTALVGSLILAGCQADTRRDVADPSPSGESQQQAFPTPQIPFDPLNYIVYRTDVPIVVDGLLNEEIWERAPWTEEFVDIEGDLQPEPYFSTRVKMLWDDDYFYFAADLEDSDLWATYDERDMILWDENNFEIFIDPTGDTHTYWEFQINAIETIFDIFLYKPYRDGGTYLLNWNLIGDDALVGVHLDGEINNPESEDRGWTLEIALSWDALTEMVPGRNPPQAGDQWRVNFSRVHHDLKVVDGEYRRYEDPETGELRPEYNWVWSPQGLVNMHYPEMWGYVQFSDRVAGEGRDEFHRDPDEDVKWALRQVYYRQQNHWRAHGTFSDDPATLELESVEVEGIDFDPAIRTTITQFEAVSTGIDGERIWHINQDGRIWSR